MTSGDEQKMRDLSLSLRGSNSDSHTYKHTPTYAMDPGCCAGALNWARWKPKLLVLGCRDCCRDNAPTHTQYTNGGIYQKRPKQNIDPHVTVILPDPFNLKNAKLCKINSTQFAYLNYQCLMILS